MSDDKIVRIKVAKNGPLLVRGPVELVDHEGNVYELQKDSIALCRCGQSKNKPFCDGAHNGCGFTAEELAIKSADPV
jgi:CDGSH iron-sulfur domain-containing protein 3